MSITSLKPADDEFDDHHVAYALSRHVGSAVRRNRARRRLKAAVRLLVERSEIEPGWYLIACRRISPQLEFSELVAEVRTLTRRPAP